MRMMMTAQMDTAASNKLIADGSMEKAIGAMFEQLKPEAAYFATHDGCRTAYVVFDMQDQSQMPVIAEPLFEGTLAKITFSPVMNVDDLRKGLTAIAQHR